ncbi:MAG: NAD-dependent epimerase/dehydratase family protein [Anaerolineae bacterium]|nr:NAD-dependent epimerase/dehydratase family protein [Anaerolineae bacterium]
MRILVTGAAGFIGSHVCERLAELGHTVVGIDCFTPYYAQALKELNARAIRAAGVELLTLDLAGDDLVDAVQPSEVVYHLAAQPGISASTPFETYLRNNVIATQRLLEAIQSLDPAPFFVNIATSSIYGADATGPETAEPKPTSHYGVTKLAAEQLVMAQQRDQGLPACSLRLFSVYGPRERPEKLYPMLIRSILAGRPFPLYEGSEHHLRSYTYVGDIIDGLVAVLAHREACLGQILNIGTDQVITTGEGIRIVEEIMGQKAEIVRRPRRPGDQLRTHATIDKARRLLGYDPHVTPEQGLRDEVAWYRDQVFGQVDP